jgi:zinc transport system substrate-binding protein
MQVRSLMNFVAPLIVLSASLLATTAMAAPKVVATTKPVHSLVSSVMAGVGEPYLVVKGSASPHTYSLRPSDAQALEEADLVFWTGDGFERFLEDALETLAVGATTVELADAPGIKLLAIREGGAFEGHSHGEAGEEHAGETAEEHAAHAEEPAQEKHAGHAEHEHADHVEAHDGHDHHHGENEWDMHFWLDPVNAKLLVSYIGDELSEHDPDNSAHYAANVAKTNRQLDELTVELQGKLAPIADKPFIVFHDAYQYFEKRFDLNLVGTVTVSPEVAPGAARIDELRAKISELDSTCIFSEPNFRPAVIDAIIEGTQTKSGVLDPEASEIQEGPNLYPELLRYLTDNLLQCQS